VFPKPFDCFNLCLYGSMILLAIFAHDWLLMYVGLLTNAANATFMWVSDEPNAHLALRHPPTLQHHHFHHQQQQEHAPMLVSCAHLFVLGSWNARQR
jgi:hypothetical protein